MSQSAIKIPIRIIQSEDPRTFRQWPEKIDNKRGYFGFVLKAVACLFLVSLVVISQAQLFNAFEAHIINVTAHICKYAETRTMGYWKNHPEVYQAYLPLELGPDVIITVADANEVFKNANASNMRNMLAAQLLAMKFNIAHYQIGGYLVEIEGVTLDELVAAADKLLSQDPEPPRPVLEAMANLLDDLNNLHQIRYCPALETEPEDDEPVEQCVKINEVYYDPDKGHGTANDEWLELYSACDQAIDLANWYLEDSNTQETIGQNYLMEPGDFVLLSSATSTWQYWSEVPTSTVKIALGGTKLFNGLNNNADRVILYDNQGHEIDAVSWGTDTTAFDPAVTDVAKGHSIARKIKGLDTDTAADWQDLSLPNPGTNPHSKDDQADTAEGNDVSQVIMPDSQPYSQPESLSTDSPEPNNHINNETPDETPELDNPDQFPDEPDEATEETTEEIIDNQETSTENETTEDGAEGQGPDTEQVDTAAANENSEENLIEDSGQAEPEQDESSPDEGNNQSTEETNLDTEPEQEEITDDIIEDQTLSQAPDEPAIEDNPPLDNGLGQDSSSDQDEEEIIEETPPVIEPVEIGQESENDADEDENIDQSQPDNNQSADEANDDNQQTQANNNEPSSP